MNSLDQSGDEQERIRRVYEAWLKSDQATTYAWHRPEVLDQTAAQWRIAAGMLAATLGTDLSRTRVLDVGCGSGSFLRQLINWGASPALLTGTEYQRERLELARQRSPAAVDWHLGDLDLIADGSIDLACANTVFSSILDTGARQRLAAEMWRTLAPGGWCMVFDFRYNNPRNAQVRRVTRPELLSMWPCEMSRYRTLLLAPPLARGLAKGPRLLREVLAALPPLRSHFMLMAQKPR